MHLFDHGIFIYCLSYDLELAGYVCTHVFVVIFLVVDSDFDSEDYE
jgi:hypothetical protein